MWSISGYEAVCNFFWDIPVASHQWTKIQGDQKVSVHLHSVYSNNPHTTDDLKMAITEYIWNVNRATLK